MAHMTREVAIFACSHRGGGNSDTAATLLARGVREAGAEARVLALRNYSVLACLGEIVGYAAGRMSGGGQAAALQAQELGLAQGRRTALKGRDNGKAVHAALAEFGIHEKRIGGRSKDRGAGGLGQPRTAVNVIKVQVRDEDVLEDKLLRAQEFKHLGGVSAGVHGQGQALVVQNVAVGLKRAE